MARGKHSEFFQNILNKINTYDWSHKRDFLVKRRKFGRKIYVVKPQKLQEPDAQHFKKLCFTEREQQLFHIEYRTEKWSREPVKRYVIVEPWRFVLRVRPYMIEKVRVKDAELESQIRQLDNYIERRDLQKRIDKILCNRYKDPWVKWMGIKKYNELNPHKGRSLQQILNLMKELQ